MLKVLLTEVFTALKSFHQPQSSRATESFNNRMMHSKQIKGFFKGASRNCKCQFDFRKINALNKNTENDDAQIWLWLKHFR